MYLFIRKSVLDVLTPGQLGIVTLGYSSLGLALNNVWLDTQGDERYILSHPFFPDDLAMRVGSITGNMAELINAGLGLVALMESEGREAVDMALGTWLATTATYPSKHPSTLTMPDGTDKYGNIKVRPCTLQEIAEAQGDSLAIGSVILFTEEIPAGWGAKIIPII